MGLSETEFNVEFQGQTVTLSGNRLFAITQGLYSSIPCYNVMCGLMVSILTVLG